MAEDFAADLARLQAACLADLKEAMPRSEMGRALMAELAAEEARERAARRCSDCVHLDENSFYERRWFLCARRRWHTREPYDDRSHSEVYEDAGERFGPDAVRNLFRTAASCDDYEEAS